MFQLNVKAGEDKRVLVFGDVHGAWHLVEKAIHDLGISDEDIKVFIGDLTDRGTQNFKCVEYAANTENSYIVRGNHDDMMIKGLLEGDQRNYLGWLQNGGKTVLEEVGEEGSTCLAVMLEDKSHYLINMQVNGRMYAFTHAEYPLELESIPPLVLEQVLKDSYPDQFEQAKAEIGEMLCWNRTVIGGIEKGYILPDVLGVEMIFHGHTGVKEPVIHGNRAYIDTGGVFNGRLTVAVIEPDGEIWYYDTKMEDL